MILSRVSRMGVLVSLMAIETATPELSGESFTMTTWYPAPVGVYQSLVTTGGSSSNPVNTILSRDAGNVGIGTTSPAARLDVANGANGATVGRLIGYQNNNGTGNTTLDLEANLASSGSDTILQLKHTNIGAQGGYGYLLYGVAGIGSHHRDAMIDLFGNMGLGSDGDVGYGHSLSYRLQLFNCPSWEAGSGCAAKSDGTTWINTSDARLKDIAGKYERGLNEVAKLQPIRFRYKKGNALGLSSEKEMIGFTAQEVQKSIPEAVFTGQDGYLRFNADPVFWAMLNAINELNLEVQDLKRQMERLSGRPAVSSLEAVSPKCPGMTDVPGAALKR